MLFYKNINKESLEMHTMLIRRSPGIHITHTFDS